MQTFRARYWAIAVSLGALVSLVATTRASATPDTSATCIKVKAEARYLGLGYNHIVHVADVCASSAECDVSTDVNPQPQHVSVPAGGAIEVNTFMGSPARVFVPKVVCVMGGGH
jgi:hypothetical protein